ncbi:MAG: methyltransferase domain-containing protein, partial [Acidimicrobiaceae bacterium]|nr:methyltransferase domain-containing protein [Acidimicrobiaceae bacterium]
AGVRVVGVNINEIQMDRARSLNTAAGLDHMVDYLVCSFMDMAAVADGTFDRGYAIESTCHAPDKAGAFAEIYRVLKPGALFWGQEMCMTDRFDPDDDEHRAMKQDLMHGIALKDIATTHEVDRMLEAVGFELIEGMDRGAEQDGPTAPWYQPLESWSRKLGNSLIGVPQGRRTAIGGSRLAEALRILPKGSADVVEMLDRTASAYAAGGRSGIFTPLYCFLARKPL